MSWITKFVLAANLIALAAVTFAYPHLMVGPGQLMPEHAHLEADCFACHAPLTGVSSSRCVTCHTLKNVGIVTTRGQPIVKSLTAVSFHLRLTQQDCVACHGDHGTVKRYRVEGRFIHDPLEPALRDTCATCHEAPKNEVHQRATSKCIGCHLLTTWKPANFSHDKLFVLDGKYHQRCTTCHTAANDYRKYTCYRCHAHTPEKMESAHGQEGISQFDNCVECHRSASRRDSRRPGAAGQKKMENR